MVKLSTKEKTFLVKIIYLGQMSSYRDNWYSYYGLMVTPAFGSISGWAVFFIVIRGVINISSLKFTSSATPADLLTIHRLHLEYSAVQASKRKQT